TTKQTGKRGPMGATARRTRPATPGKAGGEATKNRAQLVDCGSDRAHCCRHCCCRSSVNRRWRVVPCGPTEERGSSLCTAGDRGRRITRATAIPEDGRPHSARSERRQRRVDWWLTSAPDG